MLKKLLTKKKPQLFSVAFISGAAVMVVEVAATRLLTPYFGASLFIWTSAISVILGALALGYYIGSRLSKKEKLDLILGRTFALAAIATFLIPYIVYGIGKALPSLHSGNIPSAGAFILTLAGALIALMPAGTFYGFVSPLIIEILGRDGHHPGYVSGRVFAISTVGSIVGTLFTPIFFYPVLGTHATFLTVSVVVMLLAAIVYKEQKNWFIAGALILLILGTLWWPNPLKGENTVFAKESPYQTIRLVENNGRMEIVFNEGLGVQSSYHPHTPWTGSYWDWSSILPFLRDKNDQSALIIGYAGGSIARIWNETPAAERIKEVDGIEIDEEVIEIVKRYFDEDLFGANVFIKDGRQHLLATDKLYDIIYVDAYANEFQIPFHLATVQFFKQVSDHLNEEGMMVFNVSLGIKDSKLVRSLINTVMAVFPHVYTLESETSFNILIVASNEEINFENLNEIYEKAGLPVNPAFQASPADFSPTGRILTDDLAPVELMSEILFLDLI